MEFTQNGIHASRCLPGIGSLTSIHARDMEEAIRVMDDDCAQRGDCPVKGLSEYQFLLLRQVYAESSELSIRQSEEFKMFRGV